MEDARFELTTRQAVTIVAGNVQVTINSHAGDTNPYVQIDVHYPENHRLETTDVSHEEFRTIVRIPTRNPRLIVSRK